MKTPLRLAILGSALCCAAAFASGSRLPPLENGGPARVTLIDRCSKTPTAVLGVNPADIEVKLYALNPDKSLSVDIELKTLGSAGGSSIVDRSRRGLKPWPNGTFSLRQAVVFDENAEQSAGQVLELRVNWSQGTGANESGSFLNRVYYAGDREQSFYAIEQTGESRDALCQWREPVEIVSGYYFNSAAQDLEISQEVQASQLTASPGFDLGFGPSDLEGLAPQDPLFSRKAPHMGWIFADFQSAMVPGAAFTAKINQMIPYGKGGYFVRKTAYSRYRARRFVSEPAGGSCRKWRETDVGFIDVPQRLYEFAFVPEDVAKDLSATSEILELQQSPANTCATVHPSITSGGDRQRVRSRISTNPDLFFYAE